LVLGTSVGLRDVFYLSRTQPSFAKADQSVSNKLVQELAGLLNCTRKSLGIVACSKGLVRGDLSFTVNETRHDCRKSDLSLSQALVSALTPATISTNARHILVVEKEGIYHRLSTSEFWNQRRVILICGCGVPDRCTCEFLKILFETTSLPVLGLFDYNPGGLRVYVTYRFGSSSSGLESFAYVVPIVWLGLLYQDLMDLNIPNSYYQPISNRERSAIDGLRNLPVIKDNNTHCELVAELDKMAHFGYKVELEAIEDCHSIGSLEKFLSKKIYSKSWLH